MRTKECYWLLTKRDRLNRKRKQLPAERYQHPAGCYQHPAGCCQLPAGRWQHLADAERSKLSSKKGEPFGLPVPLLAANTSGSTLSAWCPLNLSSVNASGAHLHLRDLTVDEHPRHLEIWLPGAPSLVVGVRDVVSVRDALVANVAAVPFDLRHIDQPSVPISSMRAISAPSPLR